MITGYENDLAIMSELGRRIKQRRVDMNMTQEDLARSSGVSLSTLARTEQGFDTKLSNLVRILRTLGLLQNIDLLVPEPQPNYKAMFEGAQKRKRASKKRVGLQNETPFVWGEDR